MCTTSLPSGILGCCICSAMPMVTFSESMFDDIDILPATIVFDLDDTLWTGEVDCSGGPPFSKLRNSRHTIHCRRRSPVTLFDEVPAIFDLLTDHEIKVSYASRTWEPRWAEEALKEFECGTQRPVSMWSVSAAAGWGDCSKVKHLKEISSLLNVPYESMVFFDNEMRNIRDIQPLGATCGYCPDGMTLDILRDTLMEHSNRKRQAQ